MQKKYPIYLLMLSLMVAFSIIAAVPAFSQTSTVYNSIPKPLPGNVASEGPEAYAFAELGDGLSLAGNTGTIGQVAVVMSSWACQAGTWQSGCVTVSGATFSQSLTVNLYSVVDNTIPPQSGSKLATITQTFNLPYRPSSTPTKCGTGAWYSTKDKLCYHGLAVPISVDFSGQKIAIPTNGKLIVTVAYATTHYGVSPIGESAACYGTTAGCPYDSLNISTESDGGFPGYPLDANGIFVNYTLPNTSCTGATTTGVLVDDTAPGCWVGYRPQIQVQAHNVTNKPKGNGL
jgi:hypothetical protein